MSAYGYKRTFSHTLNYVRYAPESRHRRAAADQTLVGPRLPKIPTDRAPYSAIPRGGRYVGTPRNSEPSFRFGQKEDPAEAGPRLGASGRGASTPTRHRGMRSRGP